ncbi:hypothetical protein HRbin01_00297 [archaeon HR01]|nr:hypothetical protein HRbin01_00297 [archaeon HR01]
MRELEEYPLPRGVLKLCCEEDSRIRVGDYTMRTYSEKHLIGISVILRKAMAFEINLKMR